MKNLQDTLTFPCGQTMKNRFMLAPLTNKQSHEDGTLSEDEFNWLTMRAKGQFGMTMTCAAHVHPNGKGFPGQLGIFSDEHFEGHQKLAKAISDEGSLGVVQLHHAGMRSPVELIEGKPLCPSDNEETGARAMTLAEVQNLRADFIQAAVRSKKFGYHGVEIHGAHGYILSQFLSPEINLRTDEYGGSLENRARLIFEILDEIRATCGNDFLVGIRLSPERFGMLLNEVKTLSQQLIDTGKIDFLDISLWDSFKYPEEAAHQDKTLLAHFLELDFKKVLFTIAGNIKTSKDVRALLETKVDFLSIGKSGILHHDFPEKVMADPNFETIALPVSRAYLAKEGLGEKFIDYMAARDGFVE